MKIVVIIVVGILAILFRKCIFNHFSSEDEGLQNPNELFYFQSLPFKLESEMTIVDVGCGNGALVKWFDEEKGMKKVYGIDVEDVIEKVKKLDLGLEEDRFRVGIGESIPLKDGSVDVVIFQRTFHHVVEYDKALSELTRVVKPGGYVVFLEPVNIPGRYEVHSLINFIHIEDDERKVALDLIREGFDGFEVVDFEKTFVSKMSLKQFEKAMLFQRPEGYEKGHSQMVEYISKISNEDGVPFDDVRFFSTNRLNLWRKK